jgi:hypothetical protein
VVPSRPAIFWLSASTLIAVSPVAGLVSPVATATIAAAWASAMNRIPSGPKAKGPMDLNSAFPSFIPAVHWADCRLRDRVRLPRMRACAIDMRFLIFIAVLWFSIGC